MIAGNKANEYHNETGSPVFLVRPTQSTRRHDVSQKSSCRTQYSSNGLQLEDPDDTCINTTYNLRQFDARIPGLKFFSALVTTRPEIFETVAIESGPPSVSFLVVRLGRRDGKMRRGGVRVGYTLVAFVSCNGSCTYPVSTCLLRGKLGRVGVSF